MTALLSIGVKDGEIAVLRGFSDRLHVSSSFLLSLFNLFPEFSGLVARIPPNWIPEFLFL